MQAPFINLAEPVPSKRKAIILAAIGVVAVVGVMYACYGHSTPAPAVLVAHPEVEDWIANAFTNWAVKFDRTYLSNSERLYRMKVFKDNFYAIKAIMDKGPDYSLALNKFADMTREEFRARYLSHNYRSINANKTRNFVPLDTANVPDQVDWRTKNVVTRVKDQGMCGSCWAFSATGSLEGVWALKQNTTLTEFSEQQLVDCSWDYGNEGCNGGLMDQAFEYVRDSGIQDGTSYPYKGVDQSCKFNAQKVVTKISGYNDVPANDESQLAAAVANAPVSVAIEADSIVFQFYSSGVLDSTACGTDLDHGVLAVGYDNTVAKPYWIVKNSWASSWGDKGYVKILMQQSKKGPGICGIAEMASYPTL